MIFLTSFYMQYNTVLLVDVHIKFQMRSKYAQVICAIPL